MKKEIFFLAIFYCTALSLFAQKDSSIDKFGFKSLFKNKFDASKPYAAQLNPKTVFFVQEN